MLASLDIRSRSGESAQPPRVRDGAGPDILQSSTDTFRLHDDSPGRQTSPAVEVCERFKIYLRGVVGKVEVFVGGLAQFLAIPTTVTAPFLRGPEIFDRFFTVFSRAPL